MKNFEGSIALVLSKILLKFAIHFVGSGSQASRVFDLRPLPCLENCFAKCAYFCYCAYVLAHLEILGFPMGGAY